MQFRKLFLADFLGGSETLMDMLLKKKDGSSFFELQRLVRLYFFLFVCLVCSYRNVVYNNYFSLSTLDTVGWGWVRHVLLLKIFFF